MVAFASLFLSLVVGIQPVDFHVGESVAKVEVFLDGRPVGALRQEPWSLGCDFGEELLPHRLAAVAYDDTGGVLGSASQWVNLPRSPAEASLLLERDGDRAYARLEWKSVVGDEPESVRITFDGVELPWTGSGRVELPEHDPERLHFLRAELDFANNVSSAAEMTFGGSYAGGSQTELTAVAVRLDSIRKLPPPRQLQGRFRSAEGPLTVVATEEGPATVIVVRDPRAMDALTALGTSGEVERVRHRRALFGQGSAAESRSLRFLMPLEDGVRLRFIWPVHRPRTGQKEDLEVFDFSSPLEAKDGGVFWLLANVLQPPALEGDPRLADAVAVAGVIAARRNRRRAVVLVLDDDKQDASRFDARNVRSYLEALMVPLFVWSPAAGQDAGAGGRWGGVEDVSTLQRLDRAVADLNRELDRQRLVWVEGLHLPQDVRLDDAKMSIVR